MKGWEKVVADSILKLQSAFPNDVIGLILVDDGSKKRVSENDIAFLKNKLGNVKFLRNDQNYGKGYSTRRGIKNSDAEICIFTDIDFPYTAEGLQALYSNLKEKKCDVAFGVRETDYYEKVPWIRIRISKLHKMLVKTLLKIPHHDTQCGLKGFNQKGKTVFLQTTVNRYLFDLEFLKLANKNKSLSLLPVAVRLKKNVVFSKMSVKILLTEMINFLKILFCDRTSEG